MNSELIAWRAEAGRFADVRLMAELQRFVRVDRRCEARVLLLLAEVDERELFLARGYSSLFRYVVSVLRMSEAQAYLRICAARVARRYPVALEMLVQGALNLSTVKLLAPHLTTENCATLFERARDKTKREVELVVAEIAPKPDVPTRVRKLRGRRARGGSAQGELGMFAPLASATIAASVETTDLASRTTAVAHADLSSHAAAESEPAPVAPVAALASRGAAGFALEAPRASCAVLSPGRFKLELTVDQSLFDQMNALKHLLKHRVPSGDLGVILGLAVRELSEKVRKQRFAELSKPRPGARARASRNEPSAAPKAHHSQNEVAAESGASRENAAVAEAEPFPRARGSRGARKVKRRSRYVPRAVVREVFERDGAQCTFVSDDGQRCAEREMLELHHLKAFANGGAHTPDNLKVVCRSHNGYFATQDFGAEHMRMMRERTK